MSTMSDDEFRKTVKGLPAPLAPDEAVPNLLFRHRIEQGYRHVEIRCLECGSNGWLQVGDGFSCWNCNRNDTDSDVWPYKITSTKTAGEPIVMRFQTSTAANYFAERLSLLQDQHNEAVKVLYLERVLCTYRNGRCYRGM